MNPVRPQVDNVSSVASKSSTVNNQADEIEKPYAANNKSDFLAREKDQSVSDTSFTSTGSEVERPYAADNKSDYLARDREGDSMNRGSTTVQTETKVERPYAADQ